MNGKSLSGLYFSLLLVFCAFFAGCSDESSPAETVTTPAVPVAKYAGGDIVASSGGSASSYQYLILNYDAASDEYTRAFIEKKADGTWGYRPSNRTDTSPRTVLEKAYPVKLGHIAVTSVSIATPTVLPETTTRPVSGKAPAVTKISPTYAAKNTVVSILITGQNFQEGATVKLLIAGSAPITASSVIVSSTSITGVFNLNGRYDGNYNLIVTNPDGQSVLLQGAFTIGEALPVITSINPISSGLNKTIPMAVYGQNFRNNIRVTFTKGDKELTCMNPVTLDSLKISCNLDLHTTTGASPGDWNVTVLNIDSQKKGTWPKKFTITNATEE